MPPSFEVAIERPSVGKGESLAVRVKAIDLASGTPTSVVVGYVDSFAVGWQGTVAVQLGPDGEGVASLDTDGWTQDAVFFVAAIQAGDEEFSLDENLYFEVREAAEPPRSQAQLAEKVQRLGEEREALYKKPIGDPQAGSVQHFQGVVLVQSLLMTTPMFLPGVEIRPTGKGNPAESEARIFDEVMSDLLGTDKRIVSGAEWFKRSESSRPICVLLFENVYAASLNEAFPLVNARTDSVLNLLALNRHAAGQTIGTVITSRTMKPHLWIQLANEGYGGNLIGGPISGEDQHSLLSQDEAAQADPVLDLSLSLLRNAHAEGNEDFRYFRYWTILETLAAHRVARGQPVTLLDGTPLIQKNGQPRTTSDAGPRVYQYLKPLFQNVDEQSVVQPAENLWEAVRAWYDRRNATAHRGRFDPADPKLSADSPARKTEEAKPGLRDEWLFRLRDVATMALSAELRKH